METIITADLPKEKIALYEHIHMTNTQTTRFEAIDDTKTGSTLILVENYDEEFSVHQRNRSQGITLIALRHSLCIVGDRRTAYSAGQVLEGTSFKRGLFSIKFVVEP